MEVFRARKDRHRAGHAGQFRVRSGTHPRPALPPAPSTHAPDRAQSPPDRPAQAGRVVSAPAPSPSGRRGGCGSARRTLPVSGRGPQRRVRTRATGFRLASDWAVRGGLSGSALAAASASASDIALGLAGFTMDLRPPRTRVSAPSAAIFTIVSVLLISCRPARRDQADAALGFRVHIGIEVPSGLISGRDCAQFGPFHRHRGNLRKRGLIKTRAHDLIGNIVRSCDDGLAYSLSGDILI